MKSKEIELLKICHIPQFKRVSSIKLAEKQLERSCEFLFQYGDLKHSVVVVQTALSVQSVSATQRAYKCIGDAIDHSSHPLMH